jgi:glycine cleavage system regulatory protein
MTTYLVLTVIGKDKPGLVESLSQVIVENSGNWLESSMCQLAGKFAGILRVSVNDKDTESLIDGLNGLSLPITVNTKYVVIDFANYLTLLVVE